MRPAPSIRRMADGAIDYDYYRDKARAQRERALREAFMMLSAHFRSMIAALLRRRLTG